MIASRVLSEDEIYKALSDRGFDRTDERTETGVFWRNRESGKHILVPDSVQGYYPNWLLEDLQEHIGKLSTWQH